MPLQAICSVPFCFTRKSKTIRIHCYPNDCSLRHEWLETILRATGVKQYKIGEYSGVCSKHFSSDCLLKSKDGKRIRIKIGSVPTIFEQPTDYQRSLLKIEPKPFKTSDWVFLEGIDEVTTDPPIWGLKIKSPLSSEFKDIEDIVRCRTCCRKCGERNYPISVNIPKTNTTIMDIIFFLVPQMKIVLEANDVVCCECKRILTQCVNFMTKCLLSNKLVPKEKLQDTIKCTTTANHQAKERGKHNNLVTIEDVENGLYTKKFRRKSTHVDHSYFAGDDKWIVQSSPEISDGESDQGDLPSNLIIPDRMISDHTNVSFEQPGTGDNETDTVIPSEVMETEQDAIVKDIQDDETNTNITPEVIRNIQDANDKVIHHDETDAIITTEDNTNDKDALDNTKCSKSCTVLDDESSSAMKDMNVDKHICHDTPVENEEWNVQSLPDIPDDIPNYSRILSFVQPDDKEFRKFIDILASNGVDICQSVTHWERKRILLLGGSLLCKPCGRFFSEAATYDEHLKMHQNQIKLEQEAARVQCNDLKIDALKCASCLLMLPSQEELEYHRTIHPQFVCEICGKRSPTSQGLHVHKLIHKKNKDLICEICGESFRSPMALSYHINNHNKAKEYSCSQCSKIFNSQPSFNNHLRNTHDVNLTGGSTKCVECGRMFMSDLSFTRHYRYVHINKNPIPKCEKCGKEFPTPRSLSAHKTNTCCGRNKARSRRSKKYPGPHHCQVCLKEFPEYERLIVHMRMHNRSRRYPCSYCPRTFKCESHKVKHQTLIHENYKCAICLKYFDSQKELDVHSDEHSEVIFKCGICGDAFEEDRLLNHHIVTNHSKTSSADKGIRILANVLLREHSK